MRRCKRRLSVIGVLAVAAASAALAQQPPDVVTSDDNADTAMGTGVLSSLGNSNGGNTGAGFDALNATTTGHSNSALGAFALQFNTTGNVNTAVGYDCLISNTTGSNNTGTGANSLFSNTTGSYNVADGVRALESNVSGTYNVAVGASALTTNNAGNLNVALGALALTSNTTGDSNTAAGASALQANTSGSGNSATGNGAMETNTTGYYNNAVGYNAMYANTTGYNNNAQGSYALSSNTTGYGNSAVGSNSLVNLTSGYRNVGVGNNTGTTLVAGSYNVDIGWGVTGSGDETGVTRIGNPSYATATYIAAVAGTTITGAAVYVTASGQLGVLASSERYKTAVASLPADSERLQRLRPVSFHLKNEPVGPVQYGLIAEEVEQVYPALVIRDEKGEIQGVRYDELAPILLSSVQSQQRQMDDERAAREILEDVVSRQSQQLAAQREQLNAATALIAAQADEVRDLRQQMVELHELRQALQQAAATLEAEQSRIARR